MNLNKALKRNKKLQKELLKLSKKDAAAQKSYDACQNLTIALEDYKHVWDRSPELKAPKKDKKDKDGGK